MKTEDVVQKEKSHSISQVINTLMTQQNPFVYYDEYQGEDAPNEDILLSNKDVGALRKSVSANLTDKSKKVYSGPVSRSRSINKDVIMTAYLKGEIALSDMYILLGIARLSFATKTLLTFFLDHYKKTAEPDQVVPSMTDIYTKSRVDRLIDLGLVRSYRYYIKRREGMQNYYCLSAHGFAFCKRIMSYHEPYDDYIAIRPVDEAVKHLAVNRVMMSLCSESPAIEKFTTCDKFYDKYTRIAHELYGSMRSKVGDEVYRIIVEPMYNRYVKARISQKDILEHNAKRLQMIRSYASTVASGGAKPIIVLVFEDGTTLNKYANELVDSHKDLISVIYMTSASLVNEHGVKGLLQVSEVRDGKVRFRNTLAQNWL